MALLASVTFAQKSMVNQGSQRSLLQATRFAPAKLADKTGAKGTLKVSGNPIWENTMSYCLDGDFYNNIGTTTEGDTIYWAIKIEAAELVGRNNLTEAAFFVVEAGTYTMSIYNNSLPMGTPLFTQTITATQADTMDWMTVSFASPIPVNSSHDLWVVMSNSDVAYPAAGVQGGEYDNGKFVSTDFVNWVNIEDAGLSVTWMISVTSDTYTVVPPQLSLQGPVSVRSGDTVLYYAHSINADSFEWTVSADYVDTTSVLNVATVVWNTAGPKQVIVKALNTAGQTFDTIDVVVFDCNDITLPYIPNFDNGIGCWSSRSDSTESGWYASVDMFESNPMGQVLSLSAQNYGFFMLDFPVDNWLFSPQIELPATGEYELAWQVAPFEPSYDGDHYGVYVINNGDTTLLFEESLSGMSAMTQRMVAIPDSISGFFQVAFRHFNSEGGYVIVLDNIQIRPLSAPVIFLNGPNAAENNNPVTFSAIAPNASSFAWVVDGTNQPETGNTLTVTFSSDGNHTVAVTATNAVGSSTDSIVVEVYTCTSIVEFPYSLDFEPGIRCWNMVSADPANDDKFGVDTTSYNGNFGFRFSSYSRAADYNQYLISPELDLPAEGSYMLKFMYNGHSAAESFRVLASTTTNDLSAFTTVLGEVTSTATEWTEVAFLLPQGTKHIAIDYFANYMYYLYIDDINICLLNMAPIVAIEGPANAMVGEPVSYVANAPLATSFAWTVDGTAVNESGNTLSVTFDAAGQHTIGVTASNAIGSTPASLQVTAFSCDVTAPWSEGFEEATDCWTFTTLDGASQGFVISVAGQYNYAHTGNKCLMGTYSDDVNTDQWAISPAITMPADADNYKLSFYVMTTAWEGIQTQYEVRLSSTGTATSDFSTVLLSEQDSIGSYVHRVVNMSQYAGQTIRIAFRNLTPMGGDAMMIDDIELSNTVGINETPAVSSLSLFPNPASHKVCVSSEGIEGSVSVQIVDMNGRVLMQQQGTAQKFLFDVSSLPQGAYFVRMTGNNVNAVSKLVVK